MSYFLSYVISIDRYINVVSNTFYKRIVTKRLLPVTIGLVIVTSLIWATFEALFMISVDKREVEKGYIALATYCEVLIAINITINVALLTNVKNQTKKSTTRQSVVIKLTKTIAIIVATFVIGCLPTITVLNVFAYAVMRSTDVKFIQNMLNVFYLTLIPTQFNAVVNSVIYLVRNIDIKRYYCNLFNCGRADKRIQITASSPSDMRGNSLKQENFSSL